MIVVNIEVWPGGDPTKAKKIATMVARNDSTGGKGVGNYDVALVERGKLIGSGRVENLHRTLNPFHLVLRALRACGITTVKRDP